MKNLSTLDLPELCRCGSTRAGVSEGKIFFTCGNIIASEHVDIFICKGATRNVDQNKYADILFDDLGLTGQQRRDYLAQRYNGRKYFDELQPYEKNAVIDNLKEIKKTKRDLKDRESKENEVSGYDEE